MLSFGVTVLPDPPASRVVELMKLAEQHGFDYGWTYDSHILWQESYALLPIVARETKTIKLGHCVTNPGIRDPTITASWYATMQDLSGGRMVLGLGSGTRRMNEDWYDVPFSAPAARMTELVRLLRAAFEAFPAKWASTRRMCSASSWDRVMVSE